MLKKIVASAVAAGLVVGQTAVAVAAPMSLNSADRSASQLDGADQLEGGSEIWLILLFALAAAGIIILIEGNEGDSSDLPTSP